MCGKLLGYAQVDHRVPVSQGGAVWDPSNLQTLCFSCHARKSAEEGGYHDPERDAWVAYLRSQAT